MLEDAMHVSRRAGVRGEQHAPVTPAKVRPMIQQ